VLESAKEEELSDEEAIKRYYDCEERFMDLIYHRYYTRLRRMFVEGGIAPEEAEDLALEVLAKVMATKQSTRARYDPAKGVRFKTWLFTIAHNLKVDVKRVRGREETFGLKGEGKGRVKGFSPSESTSLEEGVEKEELRRAFLECLRALPDERERHILSLWLASDGEITQTEIAKIVGMPVATVNRCLRRALGRVRECLKQMGFTG